MKRSRTGIVFVLAAIAAALALASCRIVPAPVLWSLSPDRELSITASFTLTVRGSDFQANSVIMFNGFAKSTTYVGPAELTCPIAAADMAVTAGAAQTASVPVYVSTPSAGISNTLNFRIDIYPEFPAARKIADATSSYSDSIRPQIAIDAGGRICAAWRDRERLYFSASDDAGASWSPAALVNAGPVFPYRFSLAVGNVAGRIYLTWEEGSRIYFLKSADGGRSWSARAALTDPAVTTAGNPGIFVDPSGALLLAYLSRSAAGVAPLYSVNILKSTDSGMNFAALGSIPWNTYFIGDRGPRLASDRTGILYLVFPSDFGTRYSTDYLAFSTNGGLAWSTPVNVNLVGSALATDALNGIELAGANMYLPYTYKLTFKRSEDRGASWTPHDFEDTNFSVPDLAVNAFGSTDIIWTNRFVRSFDRGASWNRIVSFTDDSAADNPALAEDASGRIFIVWWNTVGGIFASASLR
jgi:hypothetical protein